MRLISRFDSCDTIVLLIPASILSSKDAEKLMRKSKQQHIGNIIIFCNFVINEN